MVATARIDASALIIFCIWTLLHSHASLNLSTFRWAVGLQVFPKMCRFLLGMWTTPKAWFFKFRGVHIPNDIYAI